MNKTGNKGQVNSVIETCKGLDDSKLDELLPAHAVAKLREDVMMVKELCPQFDLELYLSGALTPVFFGSAINNFGVKEVLEGLHNLAPSPRPQPAAERKVSADEKKVTGFIFKIQANMDPKHRDRIAFMRLCSGHFKRGMSLTQIRTGKPVKVPTPVMFLAQERELAEDAYAGDIIGIPNHGQLRIGDTLTEGEKLHFTGIPSFAPELLKSVRALDPLKSKHLATRCSRLPKKAVPACLSRLSVRNGLSGLSACCSLKLWPTVFVPNSTYRLRLNRPSIIRRAGLPAQTRTF